MLNLGGLFFTLDADTRGLMNSQRRVEQFAQTVRNAFRAMERGAVTPQFASGLLRQERGIISMLERIKGLQDRVNNSGLKGPAMGQAQAQLESISRAYDNFTRKMASGVPLNNLDFARRMQHMRSQITDTTRELDKLQHAAASGKGISSFTGMLQGLGGASLIVQGHLGGMSTRFLALSHLVREFGVISAVTAASVAGLATGIGLLAGSAIKAGRELQGLQVAFTAVSGNSAVAGIHLEYVKEVAGQAGLQFNDTARGYLRFLASAQTGGLTLAQTQTAFRGVSLAAATMQLSVEDTQGVFRALDQMMSKGTVQAEELRGQLGDRLPGAFQIAASAMGVTTAELGKMMKAGEVVSAEFVPKFVAQLQKLWNIDPSAPINTLQASINRLNNEWTYFGQRLNEATGATRVLGAAIDGLINLFQAVSANMTQIIGIIGALTGALTGLAVAWAVGAIVAWVASIGGISNVALAAGVALINLRNAIMGVNIVMAANPIGGFITLLIRLTAVVGGAVLGYKLFSSAVERNLAAFDNLAPIEGYIAAQRNLEFQVRSTTQAMMQQVMAQNAIDSKAATDALQNASPKTGWRDYLGSMGSGLTDLVGGSRYRTPGQIAAARSGAATEEADKAIAQARRSAELYAELQQIMQKPDMPANPVAGLGGDDGRTKAINDNINAVEDYILRMREAERFLQEMSAGSRTPELVEDLFSARQALNQMNPAQLSAVDQALRAAGFAAGDLDERLARVFTRTREAEDSARIFQDVTDEIKDSSFVLDQLNQQIGLLNEGIDPGKLDAMFEPFARAHQFLKDIDETSESGRQALVALQVAMTALGVSAEDTGDILGDTKKQLAAFLQQELQAKQLVNTLSQLNTEIRDIRQNTRDQQILTSIYSSGNPLAAYAGDEADKALKRADAVRQLARVLEQQGATQDVINERTREYMAVLEQADQVEFFYDRAREKAEAFRDSLLDVVETGVNGFRDIVSGAKSVGDALNDLSASILDGLWKNFILNPINDMVSNLGRGGSSGGGGGGGILGALVNGVSSLFGGQSSKPTWNGGGGGLGGIGDIFKSLLGGAKGRAFGGNMFPGELYQINEQGLKGEYFIPAVAGYMSPSNDRGGSGGGAVHIDASTYVDARGASVDAVAAIRSEIAQRDARLRQELPLLVDSRVQDSTSRGRYG